MLQVQPRGRRLAQRSGVRFAVSTSAAGYSRTLSCTQRSGKESVSQLPTEQVLNLSTMWAAGYRTLGVGWLTEGGFMVNWPNGIVFVEFNRLHSSIENLFQILPCRSLATLPA